MKNWIDAIAENTSEDHDQRVLRSVQMELQRRSWMFKEEKARYSFWSFFRLDNLNLSPAYLGFATVMVFFFFSLIWWKWQQSVDMDTNGKWSLVAFENQFGDLVEYPEDLTLLTDEDLELIENIELIQSLEDGV